MSTNAKAYWAMSIAMITVGSSFVIGKQVSAVFPVYLASAIRCGIAAAILLLLLYVREGIPKIIPKDRFWLFVQSLTGVFGFGICLLYGLKYTSAGESGIIMSTTPMIIALISFLFLKERLSLYKWLSVALAVIGIAVLKLSHVNVETSAVDGSLVWFGNLLVFFAVIGEALFTIFGKVLSARLSPLAIATFVTLLGFLMFLPFGIYEAFSFEFAQPSVVDWMYILYYAVVVTVLGFILWYYGVSLVPTGTSAVFTGLIAVSSLAFSYLFLGEPFHWSHLAGIICVLAAIVISSIPSKVEENPAAIGA
ncbi:DMT family transporter [Paenibacillus sp. SC116]|uniref:DMT family transporter n=1 Tax=Paenibacillus sp. SC116 TaxID=2968986 RepID=UPI00215A5A21|nr:DMT family transporter [Paenibacillus sp. SC116]MCR8845902.1 DMT family transporter [Paenibacillus sp. SC116]